MVKVNIYVNNYSDIEIHGDFGVSNLWLNELVLRCVASIHEFADEDYRLIIVDNGSPLVAHEDLLLLLKRFGFDEEIIWVREKWHPQSVGKNYAVKHFLDSDSEILFFLTADMKFGPGTLSCTLKQLEYFHLLDKEANCELSLLPYTINPECKLYRTKRPWQMLSENKSARTAIEYWENHDIKYVTDLCGEEAAISESEGGFGKLGRIGGLWIATRKAVETVPYPMEPYALHGETYHRELVAKHGGEGYKLGRIYMMHRGSLFRHGVGVYNREQHKFSPHPKYLKYPRPPRSKRVV